MSKIMTIKQVADELGVSTKTLRRWEKLKYFVPERDPHTDIRIYHPKLVEYWKELIVLSKEFRIHLNALGQINKEIGKYIVLKPLEPHENLPMLDLEGYKKAHEKKKKWDKKYDELSKRYYAFPQLMKRAIREIAQE